MADKLLNLVILFSTLLGLWAMASLLEAAILEFGAGPAVLFIVVMLILIAAVIGTSIGSLIAFDLLGVPSMNWNWQLPRVGPEVDLPMMLVESGYYSAWIILGLLVILSSS